MAEKVLGNRVFENARVIFRNFAGREQTYNSEGDRNFCILLEPQEAEELLAEGWNVKQLRAREEGDEPQSYLPVAVNYKKGRPPRVVLLSSRGRVDLGADEVEILDYAEVENWDVVLNPYPWEVNGNKGVKAYLKNAYVKLHEDELDLKYADVQDANPTTSSSTASDD